MSTVAVQKMTTMVVEEEHDGEPECEGGVGGFVELAGVLGVGPEEEEGRGDDGGGEEGAGVVEGEGFHGGYGRSGGGRGGQPVPKGSSSLRGQFHGLSDSLIVDSVGGRVGGGGGNLPIFTTVRVVGAWEGSSAQKGEKEGCSTADLC